MAAEKQVSINGKSFTLSYEIYPGTDQLDSFADVQSRISAQKSKGQNIYNSYSSAAKGCVKVSYAEDSEAAKIAKQSSPKAYAWALRSVGKNIYFFALNADKVEASPATTGELLLPEYLESFERQRGRFTVQKDDGEESATILDSAEIMIDNLQLTDKERVHVMQCFDDIHVQAFGRGALFASLSGYLLHATNAPWFHTFMANYDKYMRASKAVEVNAKFVLDIDGKVLQGQILNISVSQSGGSPKSIPFSMQMVVYKINYVGHGEVSSVDPITIKAVSDDKQESQDSVKNADATQDKSAADTKAEGLSDQDRIWNHISTNYLTAAAGTFVLDGGAGATKDTDQTTQKDSNTVAEDPMYPVGSKMYLNVDSTRSSHAVTILSSTSKDDFAWTVNVSDIKIKALKKDLSVRPLWS